MSCLFIYDHAALNSLNYIWFIICLINSNLFISSAVVVVVVVLKLHANKKEREKN